MISWAILILSMRQASVDDRSKIVNKIVKIKIKIVEFHGYIWNRREKYIQKSTNMSGIGSLIREIDVTNSEI